MNNRRRGFTLIELILVVAIIMVIATLAIPKFLRARIQANEAGAVAALRSISTSVLAFESTYQTGFPPNLSNLGPPPAATLPSAAAADLIDALLAGGSRSGYNLSYVAADTDGDGKNDRYTVNANPASPGSSGSKYFFLNQTSVIRFSISGPAGPNDLPIPQ
jgi:prepilin-type N-terminal cleavage/methylation domain-containing protein